MTRGGEPRMARLQAGADLSRPSGRSFGLDLDFGILGVIALAYVGVFTALGGQTIGKMAARIRVVSEDGPGIGLVPALQRTGAVVISWLTGGLGFLPALVGDHRALHDRLSRTRVVDLESL